MSEALGLLIAHASGNCPDQHFTIGGAWSQWPIRPSGGRPEKAVDGVAAVAPYEHAYAPGEAGGLCVVPLMVDGLIHPSAMLMLN